VALRQLEAEISRQISIFKFPAKKKLNRYTRNPLQSVLAFRAALWQLEALSLIQEHERQTCEVQHPHLPSSLLLYYSPAWS